jgi:hypothetical protein
MKLFNKLNLTLLLAVIAFAACEKAADLPFYGEGVAPVLSASSTTIAPAPADSNNVAVTFNWTDPKYAQDSSLYKFVIEMDSTSRNFSKAASFTVTGTSSKALIAKEINAILLGWGFEFNKAYDVDVRVISSYGNNNERKTSNTLKLRMTPYKIPPKVALPTTGRLFLVGDASQGGWNNPLAPAFAVAQEFARIDETTFGGIFQMIGAKEYLILPVNNGNWDNKYSIANKGAAGADEGGNFGYNLADNFKGPAADGLYKITLDFQAGKYTVAPFTQQHGLPTELVATGGATPLGWANPVNATQVLTRKNAVQWDITLNFTAGEKFLILPTNGSWDRKFGADVTAADNKSGTFKPEGGDIPVPAGGGSFKFTIDFFTGKYSLQ